MYFPSFLSRKEIWRGRREVGGCGGEGGWLGERKRGGEEMGWGEEGGRGEEGEQRRRKEYKLSSWEKNMNFLQS